MTQRASTSLYTLVGGDGASGAFLPLAGGTMVGPIELAADAINPLEPVTFNQFQLGLVGLTPKGSVEAATTADEDIANPATDTFDGYTISNGDKLLLQFQTNPIENGIYVFNGIGVPMVRDSIMAVASDAFGAYVSVVNGTVYGATFRICISDPGIVGTDGLVWDFQTTNLLAADGTTIVNNLNVLSIANGGITNIHVNAAAAIDRTKLASGIANRIVINDGSGVMDDAAAITAARALISDANGIPTHSSVTSTELGYVSGVTSSIQTQINNLAGLIPSLPIDLTTDVTGVLPLANGGTNSASYTQGSVIFASATKLTENNNEFFWDDTNNRLGIQASGAPTTALQVGDSDASKYLQMDTNGGLIVSATSASITRIVAESTFGSGVPAEIAVAARPGSAMGGFEALGWYSFFGRDNAGNQRRGAYIRGITSGAWTSTSLPTHMDFFTVASGTDAETQRARLHSSGEFFIGAPGLTTTTGTLSVGPLTAAKIGLYMRANGGQTADMLQIQNSSAVTIMNVESDGDLNARSLKATGTIGAGFLELADQSVGLTAPTSAIRVFSNGGNLAVKTSSPTYTLDHSLLSTSRTFQLQDSDYIVANVPAAGIVSSDGTTLGSFSTIDMNGQVSGTLQMANGGTNSGAIASGLVTSDGSSLSSTAFPSSGVVTSNGTALSSYFRETLETTGIQSVATTTPTTLTELTSSTLAAGRYRFSGVLVFQTTATGTGVGFRMNVGTASVSSCYAKWRIGQAANGTAKDYIYDQLSTAVNVSSTSAIAANTDALAVVEGTFVVSAPGTMVIQLRSETGTSVSVRANSFIEITAI